MMVIFAVATMIAQRTISGTVTDESGEPLIGASLLAKGTSAGTVSDIDGSFSLNVPAESNMLVVSYTGYSTQEVDITGQSTVAIQLAEGQILDEVVVVAGGLEKNKARLGYSLQNLDAEEVISAREVNLVDALNSKVAGVSVVSSSGSPGASSNIRIRGSISILGSNSPLFVVDGVPIDNSSVGNDVDGVDQSNRAIDLNPNDIASLTVLKGAAATALYGVRAANGAIIVTTKRGSEGKPRVSISMAYSADEVNKLPARQNTYAQGRVSGGVPIYRGPTTAEGFSWGPLISDLEYDGVPTEFDRNGSLVPAGTGNGQPANAYDPYDFFQTGNTYDLNASVAGGTDKVRYYISGGRLESTGVVPNSTFARTSFRVNTDADLTDKLNIGMSANFVNSGGDRVQRGSNLNGVMLGLLRTTPTFDNANGVSDPVNNEEAYVLANGDLRSYRNGIYDNPYWTVNRNPFRDNVNRLIGNVSANYKFTDELTLGYKLGIDTYTDQRNSAFDIQTNAFRPVPGEVRQSKITQEDLNSDLTLNYNTYLNDDVSLNVLAGYNVFQTRYNNQETIGTTNSIPQFYHISNTTDLQAFEFIERRRIHGVYLTADVGLYDFLFLNVTARNDWSSTLPEDNNAYQSYSASLGFAFSELMDNKPSWFDYGKARVSYGVVGLDAPIYATNNVFTQAESGGDGFFNNQVEYPAFGVNAFERDEDLGNPNLRPETTSTFEVGGEFKFFKGRLGFDVTYYDAQSTDVILPLEVSAASGFARFFTNVAEISNVGLELVADATPVRLSNGFEWNIAANFTAMENTVEALAEGVDNYGLNGFTSTSADLVAGLPYSVIFGDAFQRTEDGELIIGSNGWPLQDDTRRALGDPNPDWTMGLRNTFSFKGLTLSALLDFRQGGDTWCGTCGIMDYFGTSALSADERGDVVVFDGVVNTGSDENPTYVPNTQAVALASADPAASYTSFYRVRYGFGGISEMSIFDTSWLRLRELSLSYALPKSILGDSFDSVVISLAGRNLWLNTDYPGVDPETNLTGDSNGYGLDYFNMPNTRSYTASVKLKF